MDPLKEDLLFLFDVDEHGKEMMFYILRWKCRKENYVQLLNGRDALKGKHIQLHIILCEVAKDEYLRAICG